MAQSQERGSFERPLRTMEESSVRMAEDVGRLMSSWTEAMVDFWSGTTKVMTNLATDMASNFYSTTMTQAARDFADAVDRASERLTRDDEEDKGAKSGAKK